MLFTQASIINERWNKFLKQLNQPRAPLPMVSLSVSRHSMCCAESRSSAWRSQGSYPTHFPGGCITLKLHHQPENSIPPYQESHGWTWCSPSFSSQWEQPSHYPCNETSTMETNRTSIPQKRPPSPSLPSCLNDGGCWPSSQS